METAVVLLVLLSALLHASWNAFLHLSDDRVWLLGIMSIPYLVVSSVGVAVLPLPAPASCPYIAASVVLEFAYCLSLIRAYRSGDFGQISGPRVSGEEAPPRPLPPNSATSSTASCGATAFQAYSGSVASMASASRPKAGAISSSGTQA